jgi:diguanylate cyclase (GGDEF)-like protein
MLEDAIRADYGAAIDEQTVAAAQALLRQSSGEWDALVRQIHRVGDDDATGRAAAVAERVPRILALLDQAGASSRAQVRADVAHAERVERVVIALLAALEVAAIALVLRLAHSTSIHVIRPLEVLRQSANRLAAGDLDQRVVVDRHDELGDLAASFNAMADAVAGTQRQLAREASTDALSGLANRAAFSARLDALLAQPDRRPGVQAILFVDLDDFKEVNDRHGHDSGDGLLCEVARRLERVMRPGDLVARLGGDEFALLLDDLTEPAGAVAVAHRIVESLDEPIVVGADTVRVGASIGVAVRDAGSTATQLMRRADLAMYAAKSKGKNRVEVFDAGLDRATMTRLQLRTDVRSAVERDEVALDFVPVVDLARGGVVGLEVRPRWTHPRHGQVPLATVLSLAEETGAIVGLGAWVLERAVQQVRAWQLRFDRPSLWCSIGLVPRQVETVGFADVVVQVVAAAELPAGNLVLELAESSFAEPCDARDTALSELRGRGVRIALDDFGTGYSAVGRLRRLPLDIIKIDRSFTADARPGSAGDQVLAGVLSLARGLGIEVVCEGIDDERQLERLRSIGCRLGQGLALSPPLDAPGVEQLLANGPSGTHLLDH